jgi:hypothetical protein
MNTVHGRAWYAKHASGYMYMCRHDSQDMLSIELVQTSYFFPIPCSLQVDSSSDDQILPHHLPWPEGQNLQHGSRSSLSEDHHSVVPASDTPDGGTRLGQFSDECAGPNVPKLDPAVHPARDDEAVVKLETGDAIIVRAQSIQAFVRRQVKDDHTTVRASGDEAVADELDLAN